ncbi:MAG: TIGR00266 family protein [Bryobacterales bacterium]|nr:TIGR00266 family protein [Bryobacterales bacterium]
MPFCTSCGNQVVDQARFCPACGATVGGAAGAAMGASPMASAPQQYAAYAPPVSNDPPEYTIHGDNLQVARVKLRPGQELYAEAGKMLYKTANISWETRMSGESLGQKIWGALKRKVMGESLFMTYFRATSPGEVGFAGDYPGRIQAVQLEAGRSWLVQRDSFLAAQSSVQLNIALVKKIGAGFFGGEGFILEKLTGPGLAFFHAGGDQIEFNLGPGEVIQVDTGCVVGFEESVNYDIQFVGGIKTAIFGGEGLFLCTLTGPGKVIVQSMTLEKLRRELAPARTGGDERSPLGALGGIFSSED